MDMEDADKNVHPGGPTGWAAISKTIWNVDEGKINDYKEDIDTLLVFTGLFSAVLTAFVVESYQELSPDPMDTVIQLLGQISMQTHSYVISANMINSTISSSGPPQLETTFEPSLPAVRVNQLWFSSLVITLITASYAMLVKQWLREYLAMDYTSPHERLRARQFRHPGLATWKVFEIAGFLPLLLQLALGLFFLGLCFFTWSVNSGVGKASTVLVVAWAFFFVSAMLAPATSPRCPYKTALLKDIMFNVRQGLAALILPFLSLDTAPSESQQPDMRLKQYSLEEREAVKEDADETEILREVDAFLLDDDLLGTTMLNSLQYDTNQPSIITFVLQALHLRLKGPRPMQPLASAPDLRRLTKRGWTAVSDIVANLVLRNIENQVSDVGPWFEDAVYLLLAQSDQALTVNAQKALAHCVQKSTISRFTILLSDSPSLSDIFTLRLPDIVDPLSSHLSALVRAGEFPPSELVAFVKMIYALASHNSPTVFLHEPFLYQLNIPARIWNFGSDVTAEAVLHALDTPNRDEVIGPWFEDALRIFLSHSPHPITVRSQDALLRCLHEPTILRFSNTLNSLTHFSSLVIRRLHTILDPLSSYFTELIRHHDALPAQVVAFVLTLYALETENRSLSLQPGTVLDLASLSEAMWNFGSDAVGEAILHELSTADVNHIDGSWFADAVTILLSVAPYPPTSTSIKALVQVCSHKTSQPRFGEWLKPIVSPSSTSYRHVLSCLHRVCDELPGADNDVFQLLRYIIRAVPCSPTCTHPEQSTPLAFLVYDHVAVHEEWARHYIALLVGRIEQIPLTGSAKWPPGSWDSLRALLCCPVPLRRLHAEAPKILVKLLTSYSPSGPILNFVLNVDEKVRALSKSDVTIQSVISLISESHSEVQATFFRMKAQQCRNYVSLDPSTQHASILGLNVVRLCVLMSRLYVDVRSDITLKGDCSKFYDECARAMEQFRQAKYPSLTENERTATTQLAEEALRVLDSLEPLTEGVNFDAWATGFKVQDSVFPDLLFEQLASFLSDDVATRIKRVERIRRHSVGHEK
ncbi:hypothetical protein NM688_g5539 [Phlebia brevispora]|uniref:Uncharacterized protein n=1 Tax=Phlebia brevispora TaxID=194682 RepID=A0ACC1STT4_9APHY|nr:hypothetical protein NM688_g5539 [Phlebia brevispora]